MSLDRSLKSAGGLSAHRNVLTRAERVAKLKEKGKFDPASSPLGLPKVANRKVAAGAKPKKAKEEAAAPAKDAKAAAPASAAKKK